MLKDAHLLMEILKLEQLLNRANNSSLIWWTMSTIWFPRTVCQCLIILINSVCRILLTPLKIWTSPPSNKLLWCNNSKWWWILRCLWLTTCPLCSRTMPLPHKILTKHSSSSNNKAWCKWWWCSSNSNSNNSNLTRCLWIISRCKLNHSRWMVSSSSSQTSPKTSSSPQNSEHDDLWLSLLNNLSWLSQIR